MYDEVIIFIDNKPLIAYVTAMITAFYNDGVASLILRARGQAISDAVDFSEIAR
ncbi:MAG: hypothetical protein ACFFDT_04455 [Candidatus Hodarchaeota archaeon]